MNIIKLNCVNCNEEFEKYKSEYDRQIKVGRTNFFCCLSCSVSFQKKNKTSVQLEKYNLNPKLCKCCNNVIEYKKRNVKSFCNQSCAAKYNNKIRVINVPILDKNKKIIEYVVKGKKTNNCKFCGKEGIPHRNLYCSSQCKINEIKHETKKVAFLKIENNEKVDPRRIKQYIVEKRGHKCEMCGINEWGGKPILLILDHIDGNSENHNLSNFRLICSNCDTLTPTYKKRNSGKGRFARKQRYHAGKSF